jgi:hypothetical protein
MPQQCPSSFLHVHRPSQKEPPSGHGYSRALKARQWSREKARRMQEQVEMGLLA